MNLFHTYTHVCNFFKSVFIRILFINGLHNGLGTFGSKRVHVENQVNDIDHSSINEVVEDSQEILDGFMKGKKDKVGYFIFSYFCY